MDRHKRASKQQVRYLTLLVLLIFNGFAPLPGHAEDTAGQLNLERYRGQIVWLDFWASWCTPCRRSFPWLNQALAEFSDDGFTIIGVNVDKDPVLVREFLAEIKVGVPVSSLAKWKTGIQMLMLGFLIVGDAAPAAIPAVLIGEAGLWIAAGLTVVTGYDYLKTGLTHLTTKSSADR